MTIDDVICTKILALKDKFELNKSKKWYFQIEVTVSLTLLTSRCFLQSSAH